MLMILCCAAGLAVYFAIFAVLLTFSKRGLYQDRLEALLEQDSHTSQDRPPLSIRDISQIVVKNVSKIFASRSVVSRIQQQLLRAGIPLKAEEYVSICFGLIILLPIFTYLLTHNFWLTVITIIVGAILPGVYVNHQKEVRMQLLNQQLGDALVIMANALRAGFGFQQAMDSVRKELPPPISAEFSWPLQEMNLGFSTEVAPESLSARVLSDDLDMVVSGIIIQRQVGGNLAQILDNISSTIRERARIQREVRVLTAQGKLSGILLALLPLFLIAALLVLNPEYFNVLDTDSRGIIMLIVAGVFEIVGFMVIRRLTNIDF